MFAAHRIPYRQTGFFANLVLDYLDCLPQLDAFCSYCPEPDNIKSAIEQKGRQAINRPLLVEQLKNQYAAIPTGEKVAENIQALLEGNTFTVCTAHQPNLFTGPLYFIYKILHVIRLSAYLKEQHPAYRFVPVYYMGSEDADLAELNHFYTDGKRYEWQTHQTGAVGRMAVDKKLLDIITELDGQLSVQPYGREWITLLQNCYKPGSTVQSATLALVNALFGEYGLVVLIPDNAALKKTMLPVFKDDLYHQTPSKIVEETSAELGKHYNVQAHPREINLFYLNDNIRERIVKSGDDYCVNNTAIRFSETELNAELTEHPERFSPNVILRGVYQETVLPNIIFVGGGGELAYWLQLKKLFDHYTVPFPMLVLRNSFLIVERKRKEKMDKLQLKAEDLFLSENDLMKRIVQQNTGHNLSLNGKLEKAEQLYEQIKQQAEAVDQTLAQHVLALKAKTLHRLKALEQKMLRAEKRKFSDRQKGLQQLKNALFPQNNLQERVENFGFYYAKWGKTLTEELYGNSLALEQEFVMLVEE